MKAFISFLLLFSITLSGISQYKVGQSTASTEDIPHFYRDGVKMSKKNNTPLLLSNLNDKAIGNTPDEMAFNWIRENKNRLRIKELSDLKAVFKRNSLSGHTLRFQQHMNNVPVYKAEIVVHISPNNVITNVGNTFDPSVQQINTLPSISENQAFQIAKDEIKATGKISYHKINLFVYQLKETHLIYEVLIEAERLIGSWEVLIDAQSGVVLRSADIADYHQHLHEPYLLPQPIPVNGTGNVFLSDPLSHANATYGGNYSDNNDAANAQLNAAMSSVTLLDIDLTTGIYSLVGPYAVIVDHETPYKGQFQQSSGNFNFDRSDDGFEAVNCYYHIDKSMRYLNQTLGISIMPYQYSGGVQYDPHGLNGADNSHYTRASGRLAFGEGGVDDAEDADVVVHELAHGIHDWLTGGNSSQVNGLGEGCSDYWGQSYSRSLNQWLSSDPEYNWFFNWDGHNTYWGGRITNYTATYPGGLVGQRHADGQIWASCLMRIYDILGREKVDKAFWEGISMTGSTTNQQDAAIMVRQAAIDMGYTCQEVDVFTQEFTNTGYTLPALPYATVSLGNDITICSTDTLILNAGNYNNYLWSTTDTTQSLTIDGNVTGIGTFTYWVDVTEPNGCLNRDTIDITVRICNDIKENQAKNSVQVFPNPTKDNLTIVLKELDNETEFTLTDNLGRTVYQAIPDGKKTVLNLSGFSKGIYTLTIKSDREIITKKIMKE